MSRSVAKLLLACLGLAALPAAQDDPRTTPTKVRTLLRGDDTPMPGVPVLVGPLEPRPPADVADGWLVAVDAELQRLAASRVVRSDPDGALTLPMPQGRRTFAVSAGAPFRSRALEPAPSGEGMVLRVERLQQFRVRVVDHEDRLLAGFPVALVGAGNTYARAWTDDSGHATFGVEPRVTVRMVAAPWDWHGDLGSFPTVTSQLPNATALLRVPAHGTVRVRALRNGAPAAVAVQGAELSAPVRVHRSRRSYDVPGIFGVEFARVPLGARLAGSLRTDEGAFPFAVDGPAAPGQLVFADVETDPARPRVAFAIRAPDDLGRRPQVHVRVVTDAQHVSEYCDVAADGRVITRSLQRRIEGRVVKRVDVDVTATAADGAVRARSATVPVERALADEVIELGTIALEEHPPLLRGKVVDGRGLPVANARVTVQADPERFSWMEQTAFAKPDGTFVVYGPLPRGDGGVVLPTRAWATVGGGRDVVQSPPTAAQALGAEVVIELVRPARGFVELQLVAPAPDLTWQLVFTWVDEQGRRFSLDHAAQRWSDRGDGRCTLGPVPAGRGELYVGLRPGGAFRRLAELVVEADGTATGPALQAVDLTDVVTMKRLRVVDAEGAPVPRVTVEYSAAGVSDTCSMTTSDEGGFVTVAIGPASRVATVRVDGMEPLPLTDVARLSDGADVVVVPRRRVCVRVSGLPPDVPRERVIVFLRPVARDNLVDAVHEPLAGGDAASLPRPKPGSYWLRVTVRSASDGPGQLSATMVHQAPLPITIGEGAPVDFECALDEAAVAALRAALAR